MSPIESYTLLSTERLQPQTSLEPISTISQPQMLGLYGYFLLVYPHSTDGILLNVSKLAAKTLPSHDNGDNLVEMTKRIRLDESLEPDLSSPTTSARGTPFAEKLFRFDDLEPDVQVAACTLTPSKTVVILDSKGRIWFLSRQRQP